MAELIRITGGTVYDPAHGVDGEVRDLWIEDGRIVEPLTGPEERPFRAIDARGLVVMPGGVDMHCHIVGPKVNAGRKLSAANHRLGEASDPAERRRGGTLGPVPSTFLTGQRYAGLGYTTAFDAAIPPLFARQAHQELADTPCIDKGFFALVGNNHYVMRAIQSGERARARAFIGWLLGAVKGHAVKLVNPGGVEDWKNGHRRSGDERDLDAPVDHFGVTPRAILQAVAEAVDELNLPHAAHIHTSNLGLPGNWTTTLETMKLLEGRRGHLAHVQFHSYGGGAQDEATFGSKAAELAEHVNNHANLTVDVGQVMFGPTMSMTADSAVGHYLSRLYNAPWFCADVEHESGCGVVPIEYKNTALVHAWQWAIGLEWYLLVNDPWRIAMSTDHPNGGSFLAYPQIVRLLMDRAYRREMLAQTPGPVRERSLLRDLDREYTLSEIAIITRAAPARILGLANKGHLGPGADADVTIYAPDANFETMFSLPRVVLQRGRLVVENGEPRGCPNGKTLHAAPEHDRDLAPDIERWFDASSSIRWRNYAVDDAEVSEREVVAAP